MKLKLDTAAGMALFPVKTYAHTYDLPITFYRVVADTLVLCCR